MAKMFQVEVSDEEARAFELIVSDPNEWVDNAVRNKIRKCMIYVAERVAQNSTGLLSPEDKTLIEQEMAARGDVMKAPKHYSNEVKQLIAQKTTLKTRAERDAEELDKLRG